MDVRRRLKALRWTLVLGLLAAFAVAPRLWLSGDVIGPVPLGGGTSPLGAPLDAGVLGLLVAGLLPMLRVRCSRRWIVAWGVVFLARVSWDRMVWQPYLLHEGVALLLLAFVPDESGTDDKPGERLDESLDGGAVGAAGVLDAERLLIVLIYVWSGVSKLHHRFLVDGPSLVEAAFGLHGASPMRFGLSLAVALGEAGFGLMLLWPRTRRVAVVSLLLMHAAILSMLGPWAHGHNPVVWPWNLVMVLSLGLLFGLGRPVEANGGSAAGATRADPGSRRGGRWPIAIVMLVFGVAPALSYVGLSDAYLSFRLYALRYPDSYLLLRLEGREQLPEHVEASVLWEPATLRPVRGVDGYLSVPHWVEAQVGAFAPPSHEVTTEIARRLLATLPREVEAVLELRPVPDMWDGSWEPRFVTGAELRRER